MKFLSPARILGFFLNGLARVAPQAAGKIAYYLFGLPKRKKPKPQEAAVLATAKTNYQTIQGRKIAIYHWGKSGPIVLLAHGWESQAGRWRKIAPPLLKAGFQVIAVDAPAHGSSEGRHFTMIKYAEVLRTILQEYGPVDTLIGHSVGGASGIWAMGKLPPELRPRRAVIMASFSVLQTIMDNTQNLIGASNTMMEATDLYIERVTGGRIAHYSMIRIVENLQSVETLLIHDRKDKVTPFHESEHLHAAWPGSQLLATSGMGHGLTAPFVLESVLEFMGGAEITH